MRRVLVTGATGFVGGALCEALARKGYRVRAALRVDRPLPAHIEEKVVVGNIGGTTDWNAALTEVGYVIHAAALAHLVNDRSGNEEPYFETNARGTQQLAVSAAACNVRRFVYLSSVKVNGEHTVDKSFGPADEPQPQNAYGKSKYLGEQGLAEVARNSAMESAILRSPLVYGPGVRANFLRLLSWVYKGRPLPFGAVRNSRSLISVWSLCDLLIHLLEHPAASGRTWMASDGVDLSTPDLVRSIGKAMQRPVRMLRVPVGLMRLGGLLVGKTEEIDRLCGSLSVDLTQTRQLLGWSAPLSVDEAIARTVNWYLAIQGRGTPGVS